VEHLRASHDEEMGEMIDVVNDLKVKEDELATVHRDLANQNNKIQELCKQLLSQEQSHKVSRLPPFFINNSSVADPGCLSRIPDPDFYPSRIPDLGSRIPDPGSRISDPGSWIPKNQLKRGVKKNSFFVATNFTKLIIILVLKC
jgi:hypothetical protein